MHTLKSKWGVELEADPRDLENILRKVNGSIALKSDLFITRANNLYILRCSKWDTAKAITDVSTLARFYIELIRGTLDLLEVCGLVEIGTIFEFDRESQIVKQHRETKLTIKVYPADANMVTPAEFRRCVDVSMANDKLGMSFLPSKAILIGMKYINVLRRLSAITVMRITC